MSSLARITVKKAPLDGALKVLGAVCNVQPVRTITSRLEDLPPKPKPYDYNKKSFNILHFFFDKTTSRFDENTKLIVVEGPLATGKSKLAKDIAKSLGMLYLPEANLDMYYINKYGYDMRQLDPMLPPDCRSFDVTDFMKNPGHKLTARFQLHQYAIKFSQYIDALAHILSTGQGVVLDRCVYSDFVFTEAMYSQNYISKPAYKLYYEYRNNTLQELLKPHLIIYLDTPVPKVIENIKKRNYCYERSSPVVNEEYLSSMERNYKQKYLKEISNHAELLVYDWSVEGDTEIVVEDIEAIKFDEIDEPETKFEDWREVEKEEDWACLRYKYADTKHAVLSTLNVPTWDVPECVIEPMDARVYNKVWYSAPGTKFVEGFNQDMGDKNILFKHATMKRDTLPLIERSAK